jgi:Fe-S cluster assembly protein SufD
MSAVLALPTVLPTRRVEEWKYSDLRAALGEAGFGAGSAKAVVGPLPDGVELFELDEVGRPDWVKAHYGKLQHNAVSAVSLAQAHGGIALLVPKNKNIADPVALAFSGLGHVRALIVLGEGASLTLVERSDGAETRNVGVEIVLGVNAQLHHVRLAPAAIGAVQVEEVAMRLARDARYHAHYACFGAKLSRLELDIVLEGEGAEAHLSGVSVLGDEAHADITTHVTHAVAKTASTQLFKKVAGGKSRAVYQGKVTVAKGADGSDSRQTAKALLLGARAEADLKPELEIFADDVKCAHGAAVGDLDADSLFYLRTRGLAEAEARALLLHAFLEDAFAAIARDDLREQVRAAVNGALEGISA